MADVIPHNSFDTILVLDFGSQYTHLITRRLREINVYSEMLPCTQKLAELTWKPKGIILSGGPYSVYEEGSPHVDPAFFELGVPVLGICYGLQEIAHRLHADNVVAGTSREYGHADLKATRFGGHVDKLFDGLEDAMTVWMSHGDKLCNLPEGFHTIGETQNSEFAAIAHKSEPVYGIQFHPEVTHTPQGGQLLKNFAVGICGADQKWSMSEFIGREIKRIRDLVGPTGQVLGAVSGGVDSTVAGKFNPTRPGDLAEDSLDIQIVLGLAKLLTEAIGDRFHAVLVDNGCMRLNECELVKDVLEKQLGINLTVVDASEEFLAGLKGENDPEKKRKFIGGKFIDVFEAEARKIEASSNGKVEWFLQGTLYPDVIESISFKGPSQTIKTHHNVGGIAERLMAGHGLKLIEPLRELFKDEVRELGRQLNISEELVGRHPFPGPGLAIRVLGEVTKEKVDMARKADHIFIGMIREAGLYNEIGQAYAALDPSRAVGVMGDKRVYANIILLRAISTKDFMTATPYPFPYEFLTKVSTRIVNEVEGVCRVAYDFTSKPPGTIEME
ncbi:NAD/GMP synthase [Penicillium brevicompactum]|uniref:GMP synthase [glutamine-hydrolyzing] n=1 Tax=Penicillium brevicompactum TaxID=5074 RepID=A0A9W9QI39_PENBR|nr:NAD/GMP synthase [Penicillium brevicompactum]